MIPVIFQLHKEENKGQQSPASAREFSEAALRRPFFICLRNASLDLKNLFKIFLGLRVRLFERRARRDDAAGPFPVRRSNAALRSNNHTPGGLRVKKRDLRRCSSLIWNSQTALLSSSTRTFLPSTQTQKDLEQVLTTKEIISYDNAYR